MNEPVNAIKSQPPRHGGSHPLFCLSTCHGALEAFPVNQLRLRHGLLPPKVLTD